LNAVAILSTTAGAAATIVDYGPTLGSTAADAHWYLVQITVANSALTDSHAYFGPALSGNPSYQGDGAGKLYFFQPKFVDIQTADGFTCPAHDYTLVGLALTGGTGGQGYPLVAIPTVENSLDMTTIADTPFNITLDRVLFLETPIATATRQCVSTVARNVNILNSYFEGCAARDQADGAVIISNAVGPARIFNNYTEAISSGISTGGAATSIHQYPGTSWAAYYPNGITGMNPGDGGQIEVAYNYVYKPA